ncbi:MAG: class I SAM-dependent methyltransferase [Acidobacteriia bacterium]|nr:class I SAM-dependent methyltransferase [Terriglobia bacterium]
MRAKGLDSNSEWTRWGREDPLWAVFTEPDRECGGRLPWTDEEFYATGQPDWEDFIQRWHQYGLDLESCLEVGCGTGRITCPLSASFRRVFAVDISPEMIQRARDASTRGNVEFGLTDGIKLPYQDRFVKAIFSTHVLQHLDSSRVVLEYFREFFRVLDSGGTIMIHVPLYAWPKVGRIAWFLENAVNTALAVSQCLAWTKRRFGARMMRMTAVHIQYLHSELTVLGFRDIEFRTFPISRDGTLHSFVLARK